MKHRIKAIFVIMLLVLALVIVAACGGNGEGDVEDTPDPTEEPTVVDPVDENGEEEEPQDPYEEEEPEDVPHVLDVAPEFQDLDFGGREFVIFTWMDGEATADPDPTIEDPYDDSEVWPNLQRILENHNGSIRYEITSHEEIFAAVMASVMAGDPLGDMINLGHADIVPAAANEIVLRLEDFIPADANIWRDDTWVNPAVFLNGYHHSIARNTPNNGDLHLGFNRTLIQAAGLEDPGDLYERGAWDWDAFLEMLRATTMLGPDGAPLQWGLVGPADTSLHMLIGSNDGRLINDDFTSGFNSTNTIRAMEFFQQIWHTENLARPFEGWWEDITGASAGDVAFWVTYYWAYFSMDIFWSEDVEIGAVPFPLGPNNTSGNHALGGMITGILIPRGVEDPYMVYRMYEQMQFDFRLYSEPAYESPSGEANFDDYFSASLNGWVQTFFSTEGDGLRVFNAMNNRRVEDLAVNLGDIREIYGEIANQLADGEGTPASLVEANAPLVDSILEEWFGDFR